MAARATATNHDRAATQALFNSGSFTPRMHLTSRELALLADVFKLLADRTLPEDVLRLEVGRRMLDLLRADHMGSYVWTTCRKNSGSAWRSTCPPTISAITSGTSSIAIH